MASQTTNTRAVLHTGGGEGGEGEDSCTSCSTCTTCSLIAEGSSMAYSDDTCPQCGASTAHLTDPLTLVY